VEVGEEGRRGESGTEREPLTRRTEPLVRRQEQSPEVIHFWLFSILQIGKISHLFGIFDSRHILFYRGFGVAYNDKSSAVAEMGDCGHNRHVPEKWGGSVPVSRRAGTWFNTMWLGPRSTSVPSGVFIHPAVWPQ